MTWTLDRTHTFCACTHMYILYVQTESMYTHMYVLYSMYRQRVCTVHTHARTVCTDREYVHTHVCTYTEREREGGRNVYRNIYFMYVHTYVYTHYSRIWMYTHTNVQVDTNTKHSYAKQVDNNKLRTRTTRKQTIHVRLTTESQS